MQPMVLRLHTTASDTRRDSRIVEDGGKIQATRFPMIHCRLHVQHVDSADHLVHRAEAHLRHVLADLLGNEEEKVDNVLRLSLEVLSQSRILSRDANRTGIQMAL